MKKNKKTNNNKKRKTKKISSKFSGFPNNPKGNYWPYPRIMDGWWHTLKGSEQKCLDYILRHTWGFKKNADAISLTQFTDGVRNLDKGTGLCRRTVIYALEGLAKKGFIKLCGSYKGINKYQLAQRRNNTVQKVNQPSAKSKPSGSAKSKHTIKDITITDTTINNKQKEYVIKKDVVPLYASLIIATYKQLINHGIEESKYSRQAVYIALKKYEIRELIQAIYNKSKDEWWMQNILHNKSITWFLKREDKLIDWIEEGNSLGESYPYFGVKCMEIIKQIIKEEGKDNLRIIFKEYSRWLGN